MSQARPTYLTLPTDFVVSPLFSFWYLLLLLSLCATVLPSRGVSARHARRPPIASRAESGLGSIWEDTLAEGG